MECNVRVRRNEGVSEVEDGKGLVGIEVEGYV
jgi:hypothetical protein